MLVQSLRGNSNNMEVPYMSHTSVQQSVYSIYDVSRDDVLTRLTAYIATSWT